MELILALGAFYIIYGILGLFGVQRIQPQFVGHDWTKKYKRECGTTYLLLGILWVVFYFITKEYPIKPAFAIAYMLLTAVIVVFYSKHIDKKYINLLKEN